jgi:hypothetical protein
MDRKTHKHYFILPTPNGRVSLGICRGCKTMKEHYNSAIFTSPWRGKAGSAASMQKSRMKGGMNTNAKMRKLTPMAAIEIRRESEKGVPAKQLAMQHSVSRSVIRGVITGKTYREVLP